MNKRLQRSSWLLLTILAMSYHYLTEARLGVTSSIPHGEAFDPYYSSGYPDPYYGPSTYEDNNWPEIASIYYPGYYPSYDMYDAERPYLIYDVVDKANKHHLTYRNLTRYSQVAIPYESETITLKK